MVSVDTYLNENSLLILNFFFIAFVLGWKKKFFNNGVHCAIPIIWEVRSTCFPKWFEITINTTFLKVQQIALFIQICQQFSLSLRLDNVTKIFWLICLIFGIWFDHYLLPKVFIKMGVLIPSSFFCFLRSIFI